ncbi:MAG: tetratricopeptide repeat protein [Gammaproteobacteria bacterium]|nr:tetratricopeptide repeat protein [Gammaproteobacteria bacterium]
MAEKSSRESRVSPSEFMRQLRPEYYSDTEDNTTYQLDSATLEYHLDTITARNQTHEFEIFCRKLCERTICPHLKPATGPEGGGDSKADTETVPVAEEVAILSYVGEPSSSQERWAFAFSAMRKWSKKVRDDVAGIVQTGRGYQKIYCVTAQFARAKDRARIEDELSKKYAVIVTILDRSWIVEQVVVCDRKDLAYNYLGVGQEVVDTHRLGPSDYSRSRQLEDIEKGIGDPDAFAGMEMQRVTEALIAAKLSRNLERPRTETDGRFLRAVRLAERDGTFRQKLAARYEQIWTAFWWFDDVPYLNDNYDAFEALVIDTDHARNLELLCNLAQLLFNSVIHQHLSSDEAKLDDRIARLTDRLRSMAVEVERPNNALEAQTSLLVTQVNQAVLRLDHKGLSPLWPQFSQVVKQARGLGEFSVERLIQLVEVFGNIAGSDLGYRQLVDDLAAFVSERTGEAQGALILLKRAQQLDFQNNFEMIRLLGKSARQLTKKEYAESLIEALQLLSMAYRSAGMLWAARASCIFAIASICIESEEDSDLPASIVPTVMILAWIDIELRHIPEALEAIRLSRGCAASLPLDDASQERFTKRLTEFDLILGSQLLTIPEEELQQLVQLPDVLGRLGLYQSRNSLLYVLGHEETLRDEGAIPEDETREGAAEFFTLLASQPASSNPHGPIIVNGTESQCYVSRVQGIRVEVCHQCSESSILAAEAVIGSVEALFATAVELKVVAHTENFTITIHESSEYLVPDFKTNIDDMAATVLWPAGMLPADYAHQDAVQKMLVGLTATMLSATCYAENLKQTVECLFENETVLDRIGMIVVIGNSRQRIFDRRLSRLSDWTDLVTSTYALKSSRPVINRLDLNPVENKGDASSEENHNMPPTPTDHRNLGVRSVIDVHLWDRAGWNGTAFADWGASYPPAIALMFTSEEAARKIFERWLERFGNIDKQEEIYLAIVRNISADHPTYYRVLITSRIPDEEDDRKGKLFVMTSRMQTMHAESDANLNRFLDAYSRSGAYMLLPAVLKAGVPEFINELAVLKQKLSVKAAFEVGRYDPEAVALREHG